MRVSIAGPRSRRLVFGLMAPLLMAGAPSVARASCLSESIAYCDRTYPSLSDKLVGIRGWCYMIWLGWCEAFDRKDV